MWDRWSVEFYDFLKPPPSLGEGTLGGFSDLHDRAARNGAQHGTPVLVTVSGFADPGVNLFFRVSPMKGRGARTWKRYAYTLVVWLNFLQVFGKGWREATARDVEAFKDWRLTDVCNDDRIKAVSFDTDRAALNTFYTWAWGKYGVQNPVSGVALASSSGGRSGQGVGPGGERRDGFRPAGSRGRQVKWYRIPRAVLREIEGYIDPLEGSRMQAIRRAQRRGTYEKIPYKRVVRGYNARSRLLYLERGGSLSVDVLGPDERRLLFRRTATELEPLALWLSPNGMPKKFEGWEDTFTAANERIQRVWAQAGGEGLVPLWCRPHMCRHSFALKWYSLLSTVWQPRLDGFTEQELLDVREMFGGVWYALSLMLGHADPSTTRETYLEPFTALQVDYLMELLDGEETQAVEALIRTVAEQGGRTLTSVARQGAHVQTGSLA
ncbi:site-specific integrase [Streptomyces sp. NPDC048430]|uniref:site-specific integrase n=1 Tax=Streptomyces sp. NPDC048430 TaxID=3155388 RepID=UPI00344507B9